MYVRESSGRFINKVKWTKYIYLTRPLLMDWLDKLYLIHMREFM